VPTFEIVVDGSESGLARVRVIPQDNVMDPAYVFARTTEGGFRSIIDMGTAFDPEFYATFRNAHPSIPMVLRNTQRQRL
jgi:hypothetical protein